jgi:hypothetical protein
MIDEKYYSLDLINPPYPPYHEGDDLESFFINYYFNNKKEIDSTGWNFLPIKWTYIYNHRSDLYASLQNDLNNLDPNKKYFTVSQHDDAPAHKLPPNIINFSAGGNQPNTIPIPIICSPIKNIKNTSKDIFCSFVGSVNQNIPGNAAIGYQTRMKMLHALVDNSDYVLKPKHWSPEIKEERKNLFLELTSRSKFCLAPRGYGATSFRMYEAMQLNSIPVYIYYKTPFLPFTDELNWEKLVILVEYNDISNIDQILKSISEEKYQDMIHYTKKIYPEYFKLEKMSLNIIKILNKMFE